MNRDMNNRLLQYSLISSALLCSTSSNGEVQFFDIDPDKSVVWQYDKLDISANTKFEFSSWPRGAWVDMIVEMKPYTSQASIIVSKNFYYYVKSLNFGDAISSSQNFKHTSGILHTEFGTGSPPATIQPIYESFDRFKKVNDVDGTEGMVNKYAGIKFKLSGQTHFGWIKFDFSSSWLIKEYAYEDIPGRQILAGSLETSLPVELSSFIARVERNTVILSWTTESEKNNIGFILERRLAGELDWDKIGDYRSDEHLCGHGTTSEKHSYSFTDFNVKNDTTYEYRLSDIDIDGTIQIKKNCGNYH